jgi:hypothetical protein
MSDKPTPSDDGAVASLESCITTDVKNPIYKGHIGRLQNVTHKQIMRVAELASKIWAGLKSISSRCTTPALRGCVVGPGPGLSEPGYIEIACKLGFEDKMQLDLMKPPNVFLGHCPLLDPQFE